MLLEVDRLTTQFFTKGIALTAVDSVSYQIDRGETLGIVGESGCGKSVASLSLMGIVAPPGQVTAGRVILDGTELTKLSDVEMETWRGRRLAIVFQEPMTAFNPVLTIGFQIAEQIRAHEPITAKEGRHRAIDMLRLVGIPAPERCTNNYAHELSGGMRQRAMIAMALSCRPDLLIADEPTTALDVTIQAQILDLLQSLQERLGMAIQFITHDLGVMSEMADRILVMYTGRIVEEATSVDLFAHPRHPYTVGLMQSIPRLNAAHSRLFTITGVVPPLSALPSGCHFQDRCSRVRDECRQSVPELKTIATGHRVACFNPQ